MRAYLNSRIAFLVPFLVLTALLVASAVGRATDGRDFAGTYEITDVVESGDSVALTLAVRVINYSDTDVNGATVTLQDSIRLDQDYDAYPGALALADRQSTRLSAQFIVPTKEYERWLHGSTPALRVDYTSAAGDSIRRMIELAPGVVGEE
jgi:hypothetical protein